MLCIQTLSNGPDNHIKKETYSSRFGFTQVSNVNLRKKEKNTYMSGHAGDPLQ